MSKKSSVQRMLEVIVFISFLCTSLCLLFYKALHISLFLSLSITAFTVFYHFAVRLLIGSAINARFHNRINDRIWWFRPRSFEPSLYKHLNLHRWKNKLPTYTPDVFSMQLHCTEEIVQATCQSELVHECNMLASFIPLLFSIPFGAFWIFLITSLLGAGFDLLFVLIQRYNRPRLLHLIEKTAQKKPESR